MKTSWGPWYEAFWLIDRLERGCKGLAKKSAESKAHIMPLLPRFTGSFYTTSKTGVHTRVMCDWNVHYNSGGKILRGGRRTGNDLTCHMTTIQSASSQTYRGLNFPVHGCFFLALLNVLALKIGKTISEFVKTELDSHNGGRTALPV